MLKEGFAKLVDRQTDKARLESSYRRIVMARLPVSLYGAQAQTQRRAATLLHGIDGRSGSWEELDCNRLADDERGDRTSLLLGGVAGGVALTNFRKQGLIESAGRGTLFIRGIEKLSPRAQHVLCSIIDAGRYTAVGDPFPRPVGCRIIVGTDKPLADLALSSVVCRELVGSFGFIALDAKEVIRVLDGRNEFLRAHPGNLAKAS
jgi:two-component system response regulator HupR/HoxA